MTLRRRLCAKCNHDLLRYEDCQAFSDTADADADWEQTDTRRDIHNQNSCRHRVVAISFRLEPSSGCRTLNRPRAAHFHASQRPTKATE